MPAVLTRAVAVPADRQRTAPAFAGKKAVVVGTGPGGAVASAFLVKRGFSVKVFEKRRDPLEQAYATERANCVFLRPETVDVLKQVGIEIPEGVGQKEGIQRFRGMYSLDSGKPTDTTSVMWQNAFMGERHTIASSILKSVRDQHPDCIAFHFGQECKDVAFDRKVVSFEDENGKRTNESFDLLVGADGTNSKVRDELQKIDKDLSFETFHHGRAYRAIRGLSVISGNEYIMDLVAPGKMSLLWRADTSRFAPKSQLSALMIYQPTAGVINATISNDIGVMQNIKGNEEEWMECFPLPSYFPEQWKKEIIAQMKTAPLTSIPSVKRLSKMYGPHTVLVGDAAHSITATAGSGANMAIVDGGALDQALEAAEGDVDAIGKIFNTLRIREVHARQNFLLAMESRGMYLKGTQLFLPLLGKMHKQMHTIRSYLRLSDPEETLGRLLMLKKISPEEAMNRIRQDALTLAGIVCCGLFVVGRFLIIPAINIHW